MNHDFRDAVFKWNKVANTQATDISRKAHIKMFAEEATEYWNAIEDSDLIEQIDGACDMVVVAHGAEYVNCRASEVLIATAYDSLLSCSESVQAEVLTASFEEVMQSNFSKFCKTEVDAALTIEKYWIEHSILAHYKESYGYWVVRSQEDQVDKNGKEYPEGKILKGINYFKPNLKRILEKNND